MKFQVVAFIVLLVFYGCYFIKMISQKKKGIQTDQIGKGKMGVTKYIELTMKAATYLVPVVEVVSIILNTTCFHTSLRIVGVCISFIGVAFFVISVLTMHDSWRAGVSREDKTELVTKGIYQISRNPAFLGFDLVYIGVLIIFFNWILCVVSAFAMLMFHLQIINVEEEFLFATFGNTYLEYKKNVKRYLGRKL